MYGIGARLDNQPELLFLLRGVDHQELVSQAIEAGNLDRELSSGSTGLDSQDLSAIFGIELDNAGDTSMPARKTRRSKKKAPVVTVTAVVAESPKSKSESRKTSAKSTVKKPVATAKSKSSGANVSTRSAKKKGAAVKTVAKRSRRS